MDGLPYCAWHAAGIEGARTLYTLGETLYAGYPAPFGFDDSVTCFPPKGDDAEDVNQCTRAADDTRPLSLKNSDNKTICSVMNRKSKKTISASTCHLQRGFVLGRQLVGNVMDLDTCARICGMDALAPIAKVKFICPLLALFDFAAAFPSVAHEWLFAVLAARGCPDGFINVVRAMYPLVTTSFRTDG